MLYTLLSRNAYLLISLMLFKDVCKLIHPTIPTGAVPDFLWDHIHKDIDTLRVSLDRSLDDVFMFLHSLIHSFIENECSYAGKILT